MFRKKLLEISILVGIDWIIKQAVFFFYPIFKKTEVFFWISIYPVYNLGGAWSVGSAYPFIITVVSTMIWTAFFCYIFTLMPHLSQAQKWPLRLILAGGLGNLIDRWLYGGVRDFISLIIFGYSFPIFNMADIFLTLGALALFITTPQRALI